MSAPDRPAPDRHAGAALALGLCVALAGSPAAAEAPLSAIDWLSRSVSTPAAPTEPGPQEPAVTIGAVPEAIAVSPLDGPSPDATGLLPPSVTGLPARLWGLGRSDEIAALIARELPDMLPSLQGLLTTILLAEADPPADAGGRGTLLLARIDKLLDLGALDQAAALLDAAGSTEPELFRRSFDVALLTGTEDRACATMRANPQLAPTFPARIFCLARSGDWNAAALTLRTAQALGFVTPEEDALLSRFLDPELYEQDGPLPKPARPSPLVWRMQEAVGEPLPTNTLPVAFAHAELRDTAGWKAQLDAAERLARAGAIPANQLLGTYTERRAAASGGVWDRVTDMQAFDADITAGDADAVAAELPGLWARMTSAELEVPFATLYADRLRAMKLTGAPAALAFRIGLLSPSYRDAAAARQPADATEAFLIALARGNPAEATPPDDMARAIAPAFQSDRIDPDLAALLAEDRLGEAILTAILRLEEGFQGEPGGITAGLALLRKVGMDEAARRSALQLMLLERRG